MHAFHTLVCMYQDGFWVFLGMASQGMRFTRVSAWVKTTFVFLGMVLQWMRFICVSASVKTVFAFSLVWGHNACVSNACLHGFRRFERFPWYGITMHAFHTGFCVDQDGFGVFLRMASQCMRHTRLHLSDGFRVFLGMGSQCMRFTCVSASVTTTSAFSLVWGHNECVSTAWPHQLRRILRFPWYGVKVHAFTRFSLSLKTTFAFSLVWGHNECVSNAFPHRLRRLLRFPWYGVTMHDFHTRVYIG